MRLSRLLSLLPAVALPTAALLSACGASGGHDATQTGTPAPASEAAYTVVPDGKTDNYYSSVAAEFEVQGRLNVQMTAADFNDEARRQDLIARRLTAFGLYLTAYVTDKFHGIDENGDGKISDDEVFFHNDTYGGFHTMVRNYSVAALDVSGDPTAGYQVQFKIDMAGPRDLLSALPLTTATDGTKTLDVKMPKGLTVNPDSVPRGDVRNFNPDTYTGEMETVACAVAKLPDIANAFPAYDAFMSDGVYDLTLFYGHDYNTARSDLSEAREAFDRLVDEGFKAPVSKFEDLTADSGPLTRAARANGKDVTIEIRIFDSDMFTTDRRKQHDLAISELVARDVFFYNGHAGPYFGFYLDAAYAATVNYRELTDAPFTAKQQLVLAQGCQTYSQYADMLYANREKSEDNLDVITTVNYSYGQGTGELLDSLIRLDTAGNHQPVDFYTLVGDLNNAWINDTKGVFYGVMGIDGDTQLHPYADVSKLGAPCQTVADCGDAEGNVCLSTSIGATRCGVKALSADACPEGSKFQYLAQGSTITAGACLATSR